MTHSIRRSTHQAAQRTAVFVVHTLIAQLLKLATIGTAQDVLPARRLAACIHYRPIAAICKSTMRSSDEYEIPIADYAFVYTISRHCKHKISTRCLWTVFKFYWQHWITPSLHASASNEAGSEADEKFLLQHKLLILLQHIHQPDGKASIGCNPEANFIGQRNASNIQHKISRNLPLLHYEKVQRNGDHKLPKIMNIERSFDVEAEV